MKFVPMRRVNPDQPIYGALEGAFTFVITDERADGFTASAKVLGASPFDGTRYDLGGYGAHKTFEAAKAACEQFYRARNA